MTLATFADLRNESGLRFTDISTEAVRVYHYPNKDEFVINHPLALNVSKSGGHRVFNGEGKSYYIPKGWIAISWVAEDDAAHFVK